MSCGEQASYLFLTDGRVFIREADGIREANHLERTVATPLLFEQTAAPDPMPTPAES
jgi:hypothetical protein